MMSSENTKPYKSFTFYFIKQTIFYKNYSINYLYS